MLALTLMGDEAEILSTLGGPDEGITKLALGQASLDDNCSILHMGKPHSAIVKHRKLTVEAKITALEMYLKAIFLFFLATCVE